MIVNWRSESVLSVDLATHLKMLSDTNWLVKHVFFDGSVGQTTVVAMQSAQYAEKPAKGAKRKKKLPGSAE